MRVVAKTLRGYLQGISGLFISPDNPNGLTPKELDVLTALVFLAGETQDRRITTEIKNKVAEMMNYPQQVVTNYVKKLRDKKVLSVKNELTLLLTANEVTIKYAKTQEDKDNV
jgi:DNA-binding MarR family transcriptional regulator